MPRSVLALAALVGGVVSVSSLTLAGILLGFVLLSLGNVLAVSSLSRRVAAA